MVEGYGGVRIREEGGGVTGHYLLVLAWVGFCNIGRIHIFAAGYGVAEKHIGHPVDGGLAAGAGAGTPAPASAGGGPSQCL